MDIATLIGIVGGFALLIGAILLEGSNPTMFVSVLAVVVVIGGGTMAVLARYTVSGFVSAISTGIRAAIGYEHTSLIAVIDQLAVIADVMRHSGPLALDQIAVKDKFIERGMHMIADGYSAAALRESLERERDMDYERLEASSRIFKTLGEAAPGMGMVGTLIGLVSLFAHMDDPKKLGPGMAIALLTTLYGAVFSNVLFLPLGDKLANRASAEGTSRTMVIEALVMVHGGKSPSAIKDELAAFLPLPHRAELQAAA